MGRDPNLVERQFGTGRDDQVVVVDRRAVAELDTVLGRVDAPCALRQQAYALALHDVRQINLDLFALAPADCDPRIGWDEMIDGALRDDAEAILLSQLRQQFIGHQRSAQTSSDYDNFRHGYLRWTKPLRRFSSSCRAALDYIFVIPYIRKYEDEC